MKFLFTIVIMLLCTKVLVAQTDIQMYGYKGKIKEVRIFEGESIILRDEMEDSSKCVFYSITFDENGRVISEEEINYALGINGKRLYTYHNGSKEDALYVDDKLILSRHHKRQTPYLTSVEVKDARGNITLTGTIELDKSFRLLRSSFGQHVTQYDYTDEDNHFIIEKKGGRETGKTVMIEQRDKQGNPIVTRIMDEIHVLNPLLRLTSYTYYQ